MVNRNIQRHTDREVATIQMDFWNSGAFGLLLEILLSFGGRIFIAWEKHFDCVCATCVFVLFFVHFPFAVHHACDAAPTNWPKQYDSSFIRKCMEILFSTVSFVYGKPIAS